MTRKDLVDDIVKLQHELGMTLQELKAFMYANTGIDTFQKISNENLEKLRDLLRAKVEDVDVPVDVTVTPPGEELEVLDTAGVVVPVITEKEAIEHFKQLEKFKSAVLTDADYMFKDKNGKTCSKEEAVTKYIRKSGWWKIALRFGVSIVMHGSRVFKGEDQDGKWHGVGILIKAVAQNGRFIEVEGVCTTRNQFFCKRWSADKKTFSWIDTDEKNLISTAQMVAINRAVAYLVGSGELSAEEVE